jgi:hypothetical protein
MKTALWSKHRWLPTIAGATLAALALGCHGVAAAADFGALRAISAPGAPFMAEVELRLLSGEADTVLVRSASADVYARAGYGYTRVAEDLQVRMRVRDGKFYALLTSSVIPAEASVPLVLEVFGSSGVVSRRFEARLQIAADPAAVKAAPSAHPDTVATRPIAPAGAKPTIDAPIASSGSVTKPTPSTSVDKPSASGPVGGPITAAPPKPIAQALVTIAPSKPPAPVSVAAYQASSPTKSDASLSMLPPSLEAVPASSGARIGASTVKIEREPSASNVAPSGQPAPSGAANAQAISKLEKTSAIVAPSPAPVITAGHPAAVAIVSKPIRSAYGQIAETGARPGDSTIARVSGHGTRMPLGKALGMIVPQGWRGFTSDNAVKTAGAVDWDAQDVPWPTILGEILATRQISATINWDRKEIEFASVVPVDMSAPVNSKPDPTATQAEAPFVMRTPALGVATGDKSSPRQHGGTKIDEASVVAGLRRIKVDGLGSAAGEKTVSSLGVNVNLMTAISQVAPEGWIVITRDRKLSESTVVGWNGRDRSWLTVLDEILVRSKFAATMNAERHEIELFPAP